MERLTGRETAIVLEEKAKSLEAQGITPHTRELEYIALAKYENAIEDGELLPVKRGKWKQIAPQSAICSQCGGALKSNGIDKTGKGYIFKAVYKYCPYCGTRMYE